MHSLRPPKRFEAFLDMGIRCEALTTPKLRKIFTSVDSYCDRQTNDNSGDKRSKGKRIWIKEVEYIHPDYHVTFNGRGGALIDLKSKHYHSFYQKTRSIQQCINIHELHEYLAIGAFKHIPIFLLFYLWPSQFIEEGKDKTDTARIHTGLNCDVL